MRIRILRLAVAGLSLLAVPVGSSAASPVPDHGSCADFGANVSVLAQTLGSDFGSTASTVASSGAGAIPQAVVRPEQRALCDTALTPDAAAVSKTAIGASTGAVSP